VDMGADLMFAILRKILSRLLLCKGLWWSLEIFQKREFGPHVRTLPFEVDDDVAILAVM